MKRKSLAIVTLIGIFAIAATAFLLLRNNNNAETDRVAAAAAAAPILQLRDGDDTVIVYLDEQGEQRFTVMANDGTTKIELATLKELQAKLPGTAEKMASGLAGIRAENTISGDNNAVVREVTPKLSPLNTR